AGDRGSRAEPRKPAGRGEARCAARSRGARSLALPGPTGRGGGLLAGSRGYHDRVAIGLGRPIATGHSERAVRVPSIAAMPLDDDRPPHGGASMSCMALLLLASFLLPASVAAAGAATEAEPASRYDAALAKSLGADERGLRSYVLVVLQTGASRCSRVISRTCSASRTRESWCSRVRSTESTAGAASSCSRRRTSRPRNPWSRPIR